MEITKTWKVRRTAVHYLSGDRHGITAWGVYVDGCLSRVIQPHIEECLSLMGMRTKGLRPGTASPFFTVVDYPSRNTTKAMNAFGELLAERHIEGQYCDDPGRAMIFEWYQSAKVVSVGKLDKQYRVRISGKEKLHLGALDTGMASCQHIDRDADRRLVDLTINTDDTNELSQWLRLIGNIARIRWDRTDVTTLQLLGEPLI